MKIAEDFVNMLENYLAIEQEAEEAANPSLFLPKGSAKHKLPKRTKHHTQEDGTKKKARKNKASVDTGGSYLSHTAVKPDSHLAQIFCHKTCIIYFLYNLM